MHIYSHLYIYSSYTVHTILIHTVMRIQRFSYTLMHTFIYIVTHLLPYTYTHIYTNIHTFTYTYTQCIHDPQSCTVRPPSFVSLSYKTGVTDSKEEESPPTGCFLTGHNCSNDSKQRCVADSKPGDAGAQVSSTGMTLVRTSGFMYTIL